MERLHRFDKDSLLRLFKQPALRSLLKHVIGVRDRLRDIETIADLLEEIGPRLFLNLSRRSIQTICAQMAIKVFRKGEIIFLQGDQSDGYYFILHGNAVVFATSDVGAIKSIDRSRPIGRFQDALGAKLTTLQSNSGFGEVSFLSDSKHVAPRTASIISGGGGEIEIDGKKNKKEIHAVPACFAFIDGQCFQSELKSAFKKHLRRMGKIEPLKRFLALRALSDAELVRVAYATFQKSLPTDALLAKQNTACQNSFFILSGQILVTQAVSATCEHPSGYEYENRSVIQLALLGQFDIFGVRELVERRNRYARSAICVVPTTVLVIHNAAIEKLVLTNSRCARMLERMQKVRHRWDSARTQLAIQFPELRSSVTDERMMRFARYSFTEANTMERREAKAMSQKRAVAIKAYRRLRDKARVIRYRFQRLQKTLPAKAKMQLLRALEDLYKETLAEKAGSVGAEMSKKWTTLEDAIEEMYDEVDPPESEDGSLKNASGASGLDTAGKREDTTGKREDTADKRENKDASHSGTEAAGKREQKDASVSARKQTSGRLRRASVIVKPGDNAMAALLRLHSEATDQRQRGSLLGGRMQEFHRKQQPISSNTDGAKLRNAA